VAPFEFPHFFLSLFLQRLSQGSADTLVSLSELTQAWEVEDAASLASARKDAEGLVRKVTLLEGKLAEARWVKEVAEEKFYSLSDVLTDGVWWLVVFEMERQEQFKELSVL
jgi:hypothetical protein